MPRKKTVKDEIEEERTKATKSRRRRKTAPISEALAEVMAATGMTTADHLPRQLEPATLETILAAREATAATGDDRPTTPPEARHEEPPPEPPIHERNGQLPQAEAPWEGEPRWRDAVRPRNRVPDGFKNVDSYPEAGMRVNRSLDKAVAAIQYDDTAPPSRAEKDAMEERGINYDPGRRQWTRHDPRHPGENIVEAKQFADQVRKDRERMREVMGL